MFSKVLIANRGEIAVRIIRACEELGIATVAVYSELDRDALHVKRADEAYLLGPGPAAESYLKIEKLLEAIEQSGAEAVHPGYGFLAENAAFAAALRGARDRVHRAAGVGDRGDGLKDPRPRADGRGRRPDRARHDRAGRDDRGRARKVIDETIGYPVAVKAAGGGGGKGFRVALTEDKLEDAFEGAAREGEKFFGDATVYLERYLPDPRHVEVQVLADSHGNVIHLGERDCSLQRRHQKLIEEAPAPAGRRGAARADRQDRHRGARAAVELHRARARSRACSQDGEYFFLEMNTRVQVEHCVTEMVTGIDIVKEGIRVAAGEPLSITQDDVELRGHAIECRINAEDASQELRPGAGRDRRLPRAGRARACASTPASAPGSEISPMYDPMVAKLIVWDADREQATARMLRALGEYEIERAEDAAPVPPGDPRDRAVGQRRDLPRPDRGREWLKRSRSRSAERRLPARRGRAGASSRRYTVEVVGQALRRQGDRAAGAPAAVPPSTAAGRPARRRRASAPRRARARRRPVAAAAATRSPRRSRARC